MATVMVPCSLRMGTQRWRKTSDGSHTDRFKYSYDRDGNRLARENLVDTLFSELYHANGASNGYDLLNQLTEFRRGTLSDSTPITLSRMVLPDWVSRTCTGTGAKLLSSR